MRVIGEGPLSNIPKKNSRKAPAKFEIFQKCHVSIFLKRTVVVSLLGVQCSTVLPDSGILLVLDEGRSG